MAKTALSVVAFTYLFRPAADGSASVTVSALGKSAEVLEGHPLNGVVAESAEKAHTLIRKHEGAGRKPSFAYSKWGALYMRSDVRGRPPMKRAEVATATEKRGRGRPRKVVAAPAAAPEAAVCAAPAEAVAQTSAGV